MTGYETILSAIVLARLKAAPTIVADLGQVRRAHRTLIPRTAGYSVHVIDDYDEPRKGATGNRFCAWRNGAFTISLFGRGDAGPMLLDPLKIVVNDRLSPDTEAYPIGICIDPGRVLVRVEIADADAIRVDMNYTLDYPVRGAWSLELPA